MRKYLILTIALIACISLAAQSSTNWFRYASISPDGEKIAFTYKGDLYVVPATGGEAKPLTFHEAHDFMPVWSHDSKKVAFASRRFGNFDIYVIDAEGGSPLRLTYHSNNEFPYTFSHADDKIIFGGQRMDAADHRSYPTGSQPEVYTVGANGGKVDQLWTIPGQDIKVSKDGQKMIYHDKPGGENEFRKHHTSSVTRDIWVYDKSTNEHKMITSFNGEDRTPVYAQDENTIYYLSEESGTFNVHTLKLDNPATNQQVTNFEMHPVRYLSIADNGTLCYTHNGDLYVKQGDATGQKLDITIRTESKTNNEKVIPISGNIREMAVAPNGKEVAFIVRGEVFVTSVEGSMTKRITNTPAQERFVSFSPDGKSVLYASSRDGLWGIYQSNMVNKNELYFFASTIIKEEPVIVNSNDNYEPKYSPDGKEIAFIENRRVLKIFNIESKQTRTLLTQDDLFYMREGDQYFEWSPDSKWLFVQYSPVIANTEVILLSADGNKRVNLTESGYGDYNPKWINEGKQMLWYSDRHGLRSYANSGSRQRDVYTMFFTKDSWDRFNLTKEEYSLLKELEKKEKEAKKKDGDDKKKDDKKDAEKKKEIKPLIFDWDGLKERKKRLTIHSSSLGDAVVSKDGETLYYLARFEKNYNLWSTNLRTRETKMLIKLNARGGSLQWDKKMEKLFLLANGRISTIDVKGKKKKPVAVKSEMVVDVAAEREQMYKHVWNRNLSMFYISHLHHTPWDELKDNYQEKLSSIGNDFEFSELLSELLGELNVSHSGSRYRSYDPKGDQTASLGIFIDYSYNGQGIKINEIIKEGPLDKSHLKVNQGMIIQKVDGVTIDPNVDFAKYLNRKAGNFTSLTLWDPIKKEEQNVTVKPISLGAERGLLYRRWVRINEKEVDEKSNGQLAYVHISGMGDGPYRSTYEKVMGKYHDRKALIVDTRNNGGGDLVSDLAMFLTGEKFIDYAIESRSVGYEPVFRWTKPTVAMVNESNYSDGHCFACGYQDLGIGKLVGMPVPGTCSWASGEMLQNGTVSWGSIAVSAKNKAGEWMENNQTEPEIKVKNMPGIVDKGRDQQLEAAVEELMNTIE